MDDGHIWLEIIIIILLVLGNAVCSLAEIAIVGARKTKLQELIDEGNKSAVYALRLAEEKEELFATIQVGITTITEVVQSSTALPAAGADADGGAAHGRSVAGRPRRSVQGGGHAVADALGRQG